jgi:hypothetical protein
MNLSKQKVKGTSAAFGVLFSQGLEAVIIPFLYFGILSQVHSNSSNTFVAALASLKEFFAIIIILIIYGFKTFKKALSNLKKASG